MLKQARPKAVTVIGWVWIGLGLWMALGGGFGLLVHLLGFSESFFSPPHEWVWPAGLSFQVTAGASGVAFGVGLLRVQRWAYVGIQVLMGFVLAYMTAIGVFLVWMAGTALSDGYLPMALGVLAVGLWTMAALGVPIIVMYRVLRKPHVRCVFVAAPV